MRSIAVGLSKGHKYTKVVKAHKKQRKVVRTAQRTLVHDTIREICGYAPYEKRVLELLRNGFDRRALRLCKRKLGTMSRAKAKREELNKLMQKARLERLAHQEHEHLHPHHDIHHEQDEKKKKKAAKKEAKKAAKKEAKAAEN